MAEQAPRPRAGRVRRGLAKALRKRRELQLVDPATDAWSIALAEKIADRLDGMLGHGGVAPAPGYQIAAVVREYRALLAELFAQDEVDEFQALMSQMDEAVRDEAPTEEGSHA